MVMYKFLLFEKCISVIVSHEYLTAIQCWAGKNQKGVLEAWPFEQHLRGRHPLTQNDRLHNEPPQACPGFPVHLVNKDCS